MSHHNFPFIQIWYDQIIIQDERLILEMRGNSRETIYKAITIFIDHHMDFSLEADIDVENLPMQYGR